MVLTTARLRLTPWSAAFDAPFAAMNADPEVVRFLGAGAPMTPEESAAQSARFADHWERYGFGLWAAEELSSGRFVGFAGLSHPLWFDELAQEVEVGWRLARPAWGHGYATEAGAAALRHAFTELGLARVVSVIDVENTRSHAVAGRLGLSPERTTGHPLQPRPLCIYAITRAQWS
jgi:RimJ/RimL family protein N-acetyltransferase